MTDKRKAIVLVIILFVLGIALGAAGAHMWDAHVTAAQDHHSPVKDLKALLKMTPAQEQQFDTIIKDDRAKFRDLTKQRDSEWDPKYDQVRQQGRQNIRALLTPEQQATFDAFLKHLDQEHRR